MRNMLHMKYKLLVTTLLSTFSLGVSAQELELKPISDFGGSYRVSGICFLPDCMDKLVIEDIDINVPSKWCRDEGFKYDSTGKCPKYNYQTTCLRDEYYIHCDPVKWCKDNGYVKNSCTLPEYPNDKCPNGLEMYKECKLDEKEACRLENPAYVKECQNGWRLDDDKLCTYSPTLGICCNKCEGFEFTASDIPQGYVAGEKCEGCDGARYKKEINPCAGYSECSEYGPATGSAVCWTGSMRKYKNCKLGCENGFIDWCSAVVTDCSALGYGKAVSGCSGKDMLYCPYNRAKVMCW